MKKAMFFTIALMLVSSPVVKAEELEMAETVSITVLDTKSNKIITENLDYTQADQSLPAKTAKKYSESSDIELRSNQTLSAIN